MGIYPKLIFLRGEIINDTKLKTILQRKGDGPRTNFIELAAYLYSLDMDVSNNQVFFFGESDDDEFLVIMANDLEVYQFGRVYKAGSDIYEYFKQFGRNK